MTLCSHGHEEVCYECRECPVCEKQDEITELSGQLSEANDNFATAQTDLRELQQSITPT